MADNKTTFQDILKKNTEFLEQKISEGKDVDQSLKEILMDHGVSLEGIDSYSKASTFVDKIQDKLILAIKAREEGYSVDQWINQQIEELASGRSSEEKDAMKKGITDAIKVISEKK